MKKHLLLMGIVCFVTSQAGYAQLSCHTGKLDPRAKVVLQFMPDMSLEQERVLPIAARRASVPPDMNPVPASAMQFVKITADSIPVILFRPDKPAAGPLPVIVDLHGGAFVYPLQPWMYDFGRSSANAFNALVCMVDYRVAPEHRFPAAVNDSYNAFKWIANHAGEWGGDTSRLMVNGASAGANLAAVVGLLAVKDGLASKIKMQVLFCPAVDNPVSAVYASYRENGKGYGITSNSVLWAIENYTGDTLNKHANDFRLFPLQAPDHHGLPPTLIFTVEFDVLRDEGTAYAEKLKKADVPVYYQCFPGQLHTLMGLPGDAPEWQQMGDAISTWMKKYL